MRISITPTTIIACCDHEPTENEWLTAWAEAGLSGELTAEPVETVQSGLHIWEYVRVTPACLLSVKAAS